MAKRQVVSETLNQKLVKAIDAVKSVISTNQKSLQDQIEYKLNQIKQLGSEIKGLFGEMYADLTTTTDFATYLVGDANAQAPITVRVENMLAVLNLLDTAIDNGKLQIDSEPVAEVATEPTVEGND